MLRPHSFPNLRGSYIAHEHHMRASQDPTLTSVVAAITFFCELLKEVQTIPECLTRCLPFGSYSRNKGTLRLLILLMTTSSFCDLKHLSGREPGIGHISSVLEKPLAKCLLNMPLGMTDPQEDRGQV